MGECEIKTQCYRDWVKHGVLRSAETKYQCGWHYTGTVEFCNRRKRILEEREQQDADSE